MVELDNLHYDLREIDGYNKPFNIVISAREPGKTVALWFKKIFRIWVKDNRPWIYLTRTAAEITEGMIETIREANINKFLPDEENVVFTFNRGTFKQGIVDIFISGKIFVRVVSLSLPLRRIKLAVLRNARGMAMDEYIIDPRSGEKYIQNEGFKIFEAFTTWRRECDGMFKAYFLGNPYTLYNPLFVTLGVDTSKLKKGEFYVGSIFVIHWATLNPLLREKILKENPLYSFDEDYSGYALDGTPVNDRNIPLGEQPEGFFLRYVFRYEEKFIGAFRNPDVDGKPEYHCMEVERISAERVAWCFDLKEIVKRTELITTDAKISLSHFKASMARGRVTFSEIPIYYIMTEVFKQI